MNYYPFNIGDYLSHTAHLDELEDLAFRRMLDYCYLHERHLPDNVEDIAKAIRMRTHCECIANVLREFFILEDDGYINKRIASEINSFQEKSKKASESAKARWDKNRNKNKPLPSKKGDDANALRTECEGNAKQETRNTKQETIIIPESINLIAWNEWLDFRKSKKKPVSEIAAKKNFTLLAKYSKTEQQEIINNSIKNDYQGLFDLKKQSKQEESTEVPNEIQRLIEARRERV